MSRRNNSAILRTARIEQVEERIVLSATPWPALELHAELDNTNSDGADELGHALASDPVLTDISIAPHLNSVHDATGVNNVHADYGFYGAGQTVAVIDSGIAYDHYALGGGYGESYRVVGGWDFAENDADPFDDAPAGYHGTHVAGIIGSDNGTYTGVASQVDLVALRVFDDSGNGSFDWVDSALQWVIDHHNDYENPITTVNLSLGVPEANYANVPSWAATLEAKFQQLNELGIFVAVSAGNDFDMFNAQGLSYPAVSDWVVPVGSANDTGTAMSDFSQRDDHILVAPGENIISTVPDELFSFDGTPNDWAYASGTSMASPYVAGASVLVREAYAFMGVENVDQDMIYDALFDTASLIYDPITGANYRFIDVEAALDSIVTDTLANDSSSATDMGMMGDGYQFSEWIGKLNDRDYFSFTADKTGTMTFTASGMTAQWELIGGGGSVDGNTFTFDVVVGQTYTLGLMSSGGLSQYDVSVQLEESIVDWGVVERNQFQATISGEQWYSITATRSGLATIEANYTAGNSVTLEFYTGDGQQLIDSDASSSGYNRVDANVAAGETILVRVTGNCDVDFNAWNIIEISGSRAEVFGTSGDDTFDFTAGATHTVSVDGLVYLLGAGQINEIYFHGQGGSDTFSGTGDTGGDTAKLKDGFTRLLGAGYDVWAHDMENVTVAGGGGSDTAIFFDTVENDIFEATPNSATLYNGNLSNMAVGFSTVKAYSSNGGSDKAFLFDSTGEDVFKSKPEWSLLKSVSHSNFVQGFSQVKAFAGQGGNDVALLYDSSGNDILEARPGSVHLSGVGFDNYAMDFQVVKSYATEGGYDFAFLYDSVGNDVLKSKPNWSYMNGDTYYNFAQGFDKTKAFAGQGGHDKAYLYDSSGDDILEARPESVQLAGAGFDNYAINFQVVKSFATGGGYDKAFLYDSAGNDVLKSKPDWSFMKGDDYFNFAQGFDKTKAFADQGGYDKAFLYDSAGDDIAYLFADHGRMYGDSFENWAVGFERLKVIANKSGNDEAIYREAVMEDALECAGNEAHLRRSLSIQSVFFFEKVEAEAASGHTPSLELQSIDYVLETLGNWQ